jgi:ABC-type multidrug transport system fused ATPase/permease subunit
LTVGIRFSIFPGQTGVTLSYILLVQQSFTWMVRQVAEVENNMNSVERVVHYAKEVEQEAAHEVKDSPAPADWPSRGEIVMKNVVMRYRPELPPVLKGLSMSLSPGEKIGVIGRTGAGKSSIMTVIYRMVELASGSISIDGVDISTVGLAQLRKGLSIIPQDAFLFSGTLRTNLDPFGLHDDAKLYDAMKRAYLVDSNSDLPSTSAPPPAEGQSAPRFSLDSPIDDEGSNLSIGQRSLVSLARALVNNTKILILDEATASVDYETDSKIQHTIANEFKERTILCIAHRLRTIIGYDRICVMDAGMIAEFDTPVNLFAMPDSIFHGMCERSSIILDDILSASKHTA